MALGATSAAHAAIDLSFEYNPSTGDTVAHYSGTWDAFSDGSGGGTSTTISHITFYAIPTQNGNTSYRSYLGGGVDFAPNESSYPWVSAAATGTTGEAFGFNENSVYGPITGFTPSTPIEGTMTFINSTLTTLGFDASEIANGGSLTGAGGTVNWSASVVPEPSTYAAIFGCVALGFTVIRRKRV